MFGFRGRNIRPLRRRRERFRVLFWFGQGSKLCGTILHRSRMFDTLHTVFKQVLTTNTFWLYAGIRDLWWLMRHGLMHYERAARSED